MVLSDINRQILAKCDVDSIEREIDESETVSAKILECKQCISVAIKSIAATTSPTAMAPIVTTMYDKPNSASRLPNQPSTSHGSDPIASLLVTSSTNIRCVYCSGNHFSASCTKMVSQNERKEHLKKLGRCFNCLQQSYKSRNCDSGKTCRYCYNKHHQSLCDQCPTLKKDSPPQNSTDKTQHATVNTSSHMNGKPVVLLQTAPAEAVGVV